MIASPAAALADQANDQIHDFAAGRRLVYDRHVEPSNFWADELSKPAQNRSSLLSHAGMRACLKGCGKNVSILLHELSHWLGAEEATEIAISLAASATGGLRSRVLDCA